jgi:hypothetical protein
MNSLAPISNVLAENLVMVHLMDVAQRDQSRGLLNLSTRKSTETFASVLLKQTLIFSEAVLYVIFVSIDQK